MNRIKICALTKLELDRIVELANFNDEQLKIFNSLNKGAQYDYGIMMELGICYTRYYEIKKIVVDKVYRLLVELGYEFAINREEKANKSLMN